MKDIHLHCTPNPSLPHCKEVSGQHTWVSVQGLAKRSADFVKQQPGRARQKS